MAYVIVYDRNGNLLSKGDNVTYTGNNDWKIVKLSSGEVEIKRFKVTRTVSPDNITKS